MKEKRVLGKKKKQNKWESKRKSGKLVRETKFLGKTSL